MTAEPKVEFDRERASQYDLDIRRAIPGYEALHDMAASYLQTNLSQVARVLVVGSGTGKELINLATDCPQWLLTGVEPAAGMMTIAKEKLSDPFDLLNHAGFSQVTKLYNAFLFGGSMAKYIGR